MYIIPKAGVFLRDPFTKKPVPPEGMTVERTTFWNRRLRDGSIHMFFQKPDMKPAKDSN